MEVFLIDSVSAVTDSMRGQMVVTGSHGGVSSARLALAHPPALVVLNDAGGGLDQAGTRGLEILQAHGIAACTVSHRSARIGQAESTRQTGQISCVNDRAQRAGIAVGQSCSEALNIFSSTLIHKN